MTMENEPLFPAAAPSPKAQSWGAVISIIIIVLMIIVGAFYSWGKRIAQDQNVTGTTTDQPTY